MPFKRVPVVSHVDAQGVSDEEREFIARATHVPAQPPPPPPKKQGKKSANTRWDAELLGRIDEAAKRRKLSRTAWLHYACSKILEEGGY